LEIANKNHKETFDRKTKIILILDGPEKFTDEYGNEESGDWIPLTFPEVFKVIICVQRKSKCMNYFITRKYPIMMLNGFRKQENFIELCGSLDLNLEEEPEFFDKIKSLANFDNQPNVRTLSRNF